MPCEEKKTVDARLAEPAIYEEANNEELKSLVVDQAYMAHELEVLETEWLDKQAELETLLASP